MARKPDDDSMEEGAMDATTEELREFLEADHIPVPANSEFRERLRRKLWEIVQSRYRFRRDDASD